MALRWLASGRVGLAAMVQAIDQARESVSLQVYIFNDSEIARRILEALENAARRGLKVRVLVDALGSHALPSNYFEELKVLGGEYRVFNPLNPKRLLYRNHRKALVCDEQQAVIGGFNIAQEYDGDGVHEGWLDMGLDFRGPLAQALANAFDSLYERADMKPRHLAWLRRSRESDKIQSPPGELLLSGPGRYPNPIKQFLLRDLGKAESIQIISPYFLPTWGLRRRLMKRARAGARVQLLLPAKSDVGLALAAGRSLYGKLLRAGVDIREYQPQILHAKLIIVDQAVYIGSANFNTRSLHIDYELLVRIEDDVLRGQAQSSFDKGLEHATRISLSDWHEKQTLWERIKQRFAYFLMARLDPLISRWLWRSRS